MKVMLLIAVAVAVAALTTADFARATPYASNIVKSGTTVTFTLNETADNLSYTINGGAPQSIADATKGSKTFNLSAAGDSFSIIAKKNSASGYSISTGNLQPSETRGLRVATNQGGYNVISDLASPLTRYNSPRGVGVSNNPSSTNFGTVYISNSATPTTFAARPGIASTDLLFADGIYALRADGSDAFGYGDAAKNPLLADNNPAFSTGSANSPFRVTVNSQGQPVVADFYDNNSNGFLLNQNLTSAQELLTGFVGTGLLPPGQNHGSLRAVATTGSIATGDLKIFTLDEDLTSQYFVDGTTGTDLSSLWLYNVGGGALPTSVTPTRLITGLTVPTGTYSADFDIGSVDGKIYVSQYSGDGSAAGLFVFDSAGTKLYDSLAGSRTALNDPLANDILTNIFGGMAVSPDQKWVAMLTNRSDVAVIPLINGIPDLANRLIVDTTVTDGENSGRDISFDAAGNIHYVSSGQSQYRVLSPGGNTVATTTWNGSAYTFAVTAPAANFLATDFNHDGQVNATDLAAWQTNFGTGTTNSQGDASGDGKVDGSDYLAWQRDFGKPQPVAAVAAGVPEPSSLCLLAFAAAGAVAARRRT